MKTIVSPMEGSGQHHEGECPQEGCTPMSMPVAEAASQMLLLVVGGGDLQTLARQLMQTLGSLASGMVTQVPMTGGVPLAPLAAARPSGAVAGGHVGTNVGAVAGGAAAMAADGQADPNRAGGTAMLATGGQADPNRAGGAVMLATGGHAGLNVGTVAGGAVSTVAGGAAMPVAAAAGLQGLPDVLSTPEAMRLWRTAQAHGWVDEQLQPTLDMTKATILASVMADELGLKPRWKPFEIWWKISDMSSRLTRAQYYHSYPETISEYVNVLTMN